MATATKQPGRKRVRETWPSSELYHVWAHQRASYGRSTGQRVYFEGPTIYSYGHHFPMARLIVKGDKPVAVLLTTRRYSVTTSAHQSEVRSAARHLPQFEVKDVTQTDHRRNLADYRERIAGAVKAVEKARSGTLWELGNLNDLIAEGNAYAAFFKLKTRFAYPEGFDAAAHCERGEVERAKAEERRRKRDERWQARRAAENAEYAARLERERAEYPAKLAGYEAAVAAWLAGEGGRFPVKPRDPSNPSAYGWDDPVRLRVKGTRVETSRGVVFELDKARVLLRLVRRGGEGVLELPDLDIDGYRGGRIDFAGRTVSVGCHTVAFAEVERVAAPLGLWDDPNRAIKAEPEAPAAVPAESPADAG